MLTHRGVEDHLFPSRYKSITRFFEATERWSKLVTSIFLLSPAEMHEFVLTFYRQTCMSLFTGSDGEAFFLPETTLQLGLAGTGANLSIVSALSDYLEPFSCDANGNNCVGGCGPLCNLTIDLSHNNITYVGEYL